MRLTPDHSIAPTTSTDLRRNVRPINDTINETINGPMNGLGPDRALAVQGRVRSAAPSWSTPFDERPTWRGWLHTAAFVVSVPAVIDLVVLAEGSATTVAVAIYGAALLLAFGTSAGYHRLARTERVGRVLQRIDHSMIFVLIAGSYTPLCVLALPRSRGVPALWIVWVMAAVGVVVKCFGFERFKRLGYSLYPAMGWIAVVLLPTLVRSLSPIEFGLVAVSGLMYTIGMPVLLLGRPDPWPRTFGYHEVWHGCTVAAAACHFAAVAMLVA